MRRDLQLLVRHLLVRILVQDLVELGNVRRLALLLRRDMCSRADGI